MSNSYRGLVISALEEMKGDDTYRAMRAFQNFTEAEMNQEYGKSGRTPAEILRAYKEQDAKIDAAIQWVKSRPE